MANPLTDALGSNFSFSLGNIVGPLIFLAMAAVAMIIIVTLGYFVIREYSHRKNYRVPVVIYYQEPGNSSPIIKYDRGGVFFNRNSNLKRFWLRRHKIGLNPDNVPFLIDERGRRIVEIWQDGLRSFRYMSTKVSSNPGIHKTIGEEDVNWAIAVYNEWKRRFETQGFLAKYGPIMLWVGTIIAVLLLMYFLFEKFDVVAGAAKSLENAASVLQTVQAGTIIE